jgi:hypothetical protein
MCAEGELPLGAQAGAFGSVIFGLLVAVLVVLETELGVELDPELGVDTYGRVPQAETETPRASRLSMIPMSLYLCTLCKEISDCSNAPNSHTYCHVSGWIVSREFAAGRGQTESG